MTEAYTGADLFVDALEQYGVTKLFGNPGTTELPVMDALSESDVEYVLGLHEDIAVGMASGYASTRRYHSHHDDSVNPVGVVNLHVAPGLAHGLANIYAASVAGTPLVVTAGNHSTDFQHEEPILGGDLVEMTQQFTKWSDEVNDVSALPTMLRRAVRVALTPPTGPVFLSLPVDVMMDETDEEPERLGPIPNAGSGDPAQVQRATDLVVEADEPVLVLGDQVARSGVDAVEAAVDFAEEAGARVHGEMLSSEIQFPNDHDQWVSYIPPQQRVANSLMDTDLLLFVGCSTHTTTTRYEGELIPEDATAIHISDDAWEVAKNSPADSAVVGDPGLVLQQLADQVGDRLPTEERERRLETVRETKEYILGRMGDVGAGDRTDPRASKAQLSDAIHDVVDDPYIVDEGITSKYVMLARADFQPEGLISNKGGGLGYGLPASVGAAVAEEEREAEGGEPRDVIGFIGDGSYLYYPNTLYTAARYDLDLTVVVSDNRNYRILKDNTLALMGGAEEDYDFIGMDFEPPVDIPKNAESHGARGQLVDDPAAIEDAIEDAVSREGPDVLDVLVHD